jgi:hypothetical protein
MTTESTSGPERPIPVFDIRDGEGRLIAFDIPAIGRRPVKRVAEGIGGDRVVSEHWLVSSRPDYQICSFDLDAVRIHVEETRSVEGIYRVRAETLDPHPVLERVRGAFATTPWPRTGWRLRSEFGAVDVAPVTRSTVRRDILIDAARTVLLLVIGVRLLLIPRPGPHQVGWMSIVAAAEPLACLVLAARDEWIRRRRDRAGALPTRVDGNTGESTVIPPST